MKIRRTGNLLDYIRQLADRGSSPAAEDAQLLDAFVAQRDETAFAALVKRHGGLVWGACRRLLSAADAEDAFQAVFLVLVCRARDIDRGRSLAAWLHGVAYRVALKARARAASEAKRERTAALQRPTETTDEAPAGREDLDAALDRLPERFRLPLILCYLQGKTNAEAAALLGVPVGSMSKRLDRGRELLRERLQGREATALAGLLPTAAPPALETATVRSAALLAAGGVGGVPNQAANWLVRDALRSMWVVKLKWAAAAAVLLAGLFGGIVGLGPKPHASADAAPADIDAAPPAAAVDSRELPAFALARLGGAQFRHPAPVNWAGFSPDGKILASVDDAGLVRLWAPETGKLLREWNGGETEVYFAAFSPDGATLALQGHNLRFWDAKTGNPLGEPISGGRVTGLTFLPDGKSVALDRMSPKGVAVSVESAPEGKPLRMVAEDVLGAGVCTVALSPDGKTMAVRRSQQAGLALLDLATGNRLHWLAWNADNGVLFGSGGRYPTNTVAFSPDGKRLAAGIAGGRIQLWDVATGKPTQDIPCKHVNVPTVLFSPDGKSLVTSITTTDYQHKVIVWSLETGKPIREFGPFSDIITSLAVSRDSAVLTLATGEHVVRLFDLNTGKERFAQEGHTVSVVGLSVASDGKRIVSAARDGSVCVWDRTSGKQLRREQVAPYLFLAGPGPDAAALVFGSGKEQRTIEVYDPIAGKPRVRFEAFGPHDELNGLLARLAFLALAPEGEILAIAEDCSKEKARRPVRLWNVVTGKPMGDAEEERFSHDQIFGLAFSPDGKTLWTSHHNPWRRGEPHSYLTGWDVARKTECGVLELPLDAEHVVVSPNGQLFATAPRRLSGTSHPTIRVWSANRAKEVPLERDDLLAVGTLLRDGKARQLPATPLAHEFDAVGALAFTPDNRMLISGHKRSILVWEIASGKVRATLTGHEGVVEHLAVLPGGRALASASSDGGVVLWDLSEKAFAKEKTGIRECWANLSSDDASVAFQSLCGLVARPQEAVSLLEEQVKPAVAPPVGRIAELLKALDAPQAEVREQATDELERIGEAAVADLQQVLQAGPSLEVRRRLESILERVTWQNPSGRQLQSLRAVETLQCIGTPAARRILESLSKGIPEARLSREARDAIRQGETAR